VPPAQSATDHPPDPELAAEQEHLAESRRQLARMRERTAALDSAASANARRESVQGKSMSRG